MFWTRIPLAASWVAHALTFSRRSFYSGQLVSMMARVLGMSNLVAHTGDERALLGVRSGARRGASGPRT